MKDIASVFTELGIIIIGLSLLTRLASRWGFSAIPLYLLAGLAFGNGGILPLRFTEEFIHITAEIGVILLLFMLGLEYTGEQLGQNLRKGLAGGLFDLILNFLPGFGMGLLLGWSPLAAILLGGVTYISSSGVIAKVLADLRRMNNPETPTIISILVLEDLVMAVYLPLVAILLIGQGFVSAVISILVALLTVGIVLVIALRFGKKLSSFISHQSDEAILFTTFGLMLLVAGIANGCRSQPRSGRFWSALPSRIPLRSERTI